MPNGRILFGQALYTYLPDGMHLEHKNLFRFREKVIFEPKVSIKTTQNNVG